MDLAEGEAVRHFRLAADIPIGQDLRSIQEGSVPQPAHRAAFTVRAEYQLRNRRWCSRTFTSRVT
jgi:hypothetical protein